MVSHSDINIAELFIWEFFRRLLLCVYWGFSKGIQVGGNICWCSHSAVIIISSKLSLADEQVHKAKNAFGSHNYRYLLLQILCGLWTSIKNNVSFFYQSNLREKFSFPNHSGWALWPQWFHMRAEFLRQKLSNDRFCVGGWNRALRVY